MRYHSLFCVFPSLDPSERNPSSSPTRVFHAVYTFCLRDQLHIPKVINKERAPATRLQHPGLSITSLLCLELDHSFADPPAYSALVTSSLDA